MKLLICPLKKELKLLLEQLKSSGHSWEVERVGRQSIWKIPKIKLICAVGGRGKSQFAISTQYLLSNLPNITQVITFGSGGALTRQAEIFDLVVGTASVEHDFKELLNPTLPWFEADRDMVEKAAKFTPPNFNIHLGKIASGDEDIADSSRAQELAEKTGAIAVGWEGAGSARACSLNQIPHIEIRAVTDNCSDNTPTDFFQNLPQAIKNASQLPLSL